MWLFFGVVRISTVMFCTIWYYFIRLKDILTIYQLSIWSKIVFIYFFCISIHYYTIRKYINIHITTVSNVMLRFIMDCSLDGRIHPLVKLHSNEELSLVIQKVSTPFTFQASFGITSLLECLRQINLKLEDCGDWI